MCQRLAKQDQVGQDRPQDCQILERGKTRGFSIAKGQSHADMCKAPENAGTYEVEKLR